jgi:hypothetical protein
MKYHIERLSESDVRVQDRETEREREDAYNCVCFGLQTDLAGDMAAKEDRGSSMTRFKTRERVNIDVEQLLMAMEEALPQRTKRERTNREKQEGDFGSARDRDPGSVREHRSSPKEHLVRHVTMIKRLVPVLLSRDHVSMYSTLSLLLRRSSTGERLQQ